MKLLELAKNRCIVFCEETTLHGWNYIVKVDGIIRKMIWMIAMLVCYGFAAFIIFSLSNTYQESTTSTSIKTSTANMSDVPFPSIHICSENQVTASFLRKLGFNKTSPQTNALYHEYIFGTPKGHKSIKAKEDEYIEELQEQMKLNYDWHDNILVKRISSQVCPDQIIFVNYQQKQKQFYNSYKSTATFGSCCFIQPYLDLIEQMDYSIDVFPADKMSTIPKGIQQGHDDGLKVLLDFEMFDYAFRKASTGFSIFVGNPLDKNRVDEEGTSVSPGMETFIGLSFSNTQATRPVIEKLTPQRRNCFDDGEIDLPILTHELGYRYSMGNCQYEAGVQAVISNCNCIPTFFVEPFNFQGISNTDLQICHGKDLTCMEFQMNVVEGNLTLLVHDLKNNGKLIQIQCLSNCDHQVISINTSVRKYPNKLAFEQTTHICFALKKITRICQDETKKALFLESYQNEVSCEQILEAERDDKDYNCSSFISTPALLKKNSNLTSFLFKYAEENFAYVKVFSKFPYHTKIQMSLEMNEIQFISNLGGLLGLLMGLSIISLFELIYHVCDDFICILSNAK